MPLVNVVTRGGYGWDLLRELHTVLSEISGDRPLQLNLNKTNDVFERQRFQWWDTASAGLGKFESHQTLPGNVLTNVVAKGNTL